MFRKIAADSLVINGVDTQTNAHQTGERHTWTGSASEGRPTLAALYAAAKAPNAPIALFNNGLFGADQGLVRTARTSPGGLKELLRPRPHWRSSTCEVQSPGTQCPERARAV